MNVRYNKRYPQKKEVTGMTRHGCRCDIRNARYSRAPVIVRNAVPGKLPVLYLVAFFLQQDEQISVLGVYLGVS
jgi:hypothetical protein